MMEKGEAKNYLRDNLDRLPIEYQLNIVTETHDFMMKRLRFWQNFTEVQKHAIKQEKTL